MISLTRKKEYPGNGGKVWDGNGDDESAPVGDEDGQSGQDGSGEAPDEVDGISDEGAVRRRKHLAHVHKTNVVTSRRQSAI